jgi:hypothetical protein
MNDCGGNTYQNKVLILRLYSGKIFQRNILIINMKEGDYLGDLDVDGKTILKWIVQGEPSN